eukprot:Hpha_TRINITY_DN16896_c0_g9::TRINITY_DN16896_c0_g9_i1::g.149223::m.149223
MSEQGKVMRWVNKPTKDGKRSAYGFAVTTDGRTVYIPSKELGGTDKRLKVGATLRFDVNQVDGHDGRLLASNVSGPGVVTWDEWKEDESGKELALQTKQEWEDHKAGQGWTGENREKRAATSSAPPAKRSRQDGNEKRKDVDGRFYTKLEFKQQYGGYKEWDARAPKPPPQPRGGLGGRGRGAGGIEKRLDTDGRPYSKDEFKKEYGGYAEWDMAAPVSRGRGRGRGGRGR